jgi:hypothetical protein
MGLRELINIEFYYLYQRLKGRELF